MKEKSYHIRKSSLIRFLLGCIIIVLVYVGAFTISYRRYTKQDYERFYNNARILVNEQYQERIKREEGTENARKEKQSEGKADTPYCILNLQGKVTEVWDNTYYALGEQVNLQEVLMYDASFASQHQEITKVTFPLMEEQTTTGYVIYFLKTSDVWKSTRGQRAWQIIKPFAFATGVLLLFLVYGIYYFVVKIRKPINLISESAHAIIEGNYDRQVLKMHSGDWQGDEVDQLVYVFELMRDELKDRQEREEKLKQSQKELISCISHDLKTPISTIKAYSEGIRDGLAKNPEKQRNYAEVIVRKSEILSQMISDLLDHSNAELNELKIYKEEVYMRLYLKRTLEEMEPYVRKQGISFTYENMKEDVLVNMDERRITQVLYNLVENAMKYMDKEVGRIHLRCWYDAGEKSIGIMVQDNGSGIRMEDIPYVFNRFFRGEKSRNMSVPGCGLGLSICKYIVEQHGGTITCNSRRGEGTEFYVTIKTE
ncbi:sensor histidine kinase [Anaerosporobacter faecicola]|uniref:sensor histidine kinase n=1 Tax=Anaerosporobacter faecicola TaxID=2718714 RepID=UPI00143AAC41|nr:HAMP domain-containing sensor histidine kinase [Anaerosporobacter faecicola]